METAARHRIRFIQIIGCSALILFLPVFADAAEQFTMDSARAAASKGDAQAEYFLARQYAKGTGVKQDYAKAAELLRQAADQGLAFAQNDLGAYYATGQGVKQNFDEAAKWYRKAAEQGDPLAQFSMGRIYSLGRGVPADMQESVKWFKKSAEQNQPDALEMLGDIYLAGRKGIKPDYAEAYNCFEKAVNLGRFAALNSIGYMHEHGNGRPVDPERAVAAYREAAEKNDGRAAMNLGRMYETGLGVKKDLVEAYKWFCLAQHNGEGIGTHYIEELEDQYHMESPQIEEARRRADEFIKSHPRQRKGA